MLLARSALVLALCLLFASPQAHAEPTGFDLLVDQDGVYQVDFETLAEKLLTPQPVSRLSLQRDGEAVPVWVDGGDGLSFGPGSRLTFVGQHRRGQHSHFDEHSRQNVYRLRFDGDTPLLGSTLPTRKADAKGQSALVRRHLEEDRVRVRFAQGRVEPGAEVWYWQRLSVLDRQPFELPIDLGRVSGPQEHTVHLRLSLRGWSFSHRPSEIPDHRVELLWNGQQIAAAEWHGQEEHVLEVERVPAELLRDGANSLQLRIPARRSGPKDDLVVDVALLNWVQIEHTFDGEIEEGQLSLRFPPDGSLTLTRKHSDPVWLYSDAGERAELAGDAGRFSAPFSGNVILKAGAPREPVDIRQYRPSNLRDTERQADYLMIAHASLLEAAKPLAEFRRAQGLEVALVDVQDIYNEFNHGVLSPHAIREFAAYTFNNWRKPAPRFVLLVGDASWENHGETLDESNYADWTYQDHERSIGRFVKNQSTAYAGTSTSRNLIPTLHVETSEGLAASDSELVAIDGDNWIPDMAIGRFPVVEPSDVASIVRKIIDYETKAPVGPWRRSLLWISNEETYMQRFTDAVALSGTEFGTRPTKVFPEASATDNSLYQSQLVNEFDEGQLLVHFLGHGGRYIWRTGPPDPRRNHDLFTLDHIDQLQPTAKLPVILSMTCYSAPFDHPTADSIGEKFLRAEGRGAVGVLAASWRNAPTRDFSRELVGNLLGGAPTVGEAILAAKRVTPLRVLVQTYNYLGDPATRLSAPSRQLVASLRAEGDAARLVIEQLPDAELKSGRLMVDLIDAQGNRIDTLEYSAAAEPILIKPIRAQGGEAVAAVSVYWWNEALQLDGKAFLEMPSFPEPSTSAGAQAPGNEPSAQDRAALSRPAGT